MRCLLLLTAVVLPLQACATGIALDGDDEDQDAELFDSADAATPGADAAVRSDAAIRSDAASASDAATDATSIDDAGLPDAIGGGTVDSCAQALDLTNAAMADAGVIVTGDTTGYLNDVEPAVACTGFSPDGPDAIYAVTVDAGAVISATVTPNSTFDVTLEIVSPCALVPTCHGGSDTGYLGGAESVSFTATVAGTYHVVVDSWSPGAAGSYSLNVRVQ